MREALKILDAVGVIEIRRGIGTFVRPEAASALGYLTMFQTVMKTATTKELYQTRLMVEHAAAEIVAQRGSQEDLRKIIEANERFREVAEAEVADYDLATELDIAFHKTVFAVCGNPLIGAIGNLVIEQVRPWIRESHEVAGLQVTVRMHQELIDGLSNAAESDKSGIELTRAVRIGLESWRERLEKIG